MKKIFLIILIIFLLSLFSDKETDDIVDHVGYENSNNSHSEVLF